MQKLDAKPRVLIVDDDFATGQALTDQLTGAGYACELAGTSELALATAERASCDIVICGVQSAGMQALELLDALKRDYPALPVIVVSGSRSVAEAIEAIKHGAFQYLGTPLDLAELRGFMVQATHAGALLRESVRAVPQPGLESAGELVHASQAMRTLLESVTLVAVSSAPVLLSGESGTGKERIARAIHAAGPRRERPFVAINMSAIPETLLESELFGHQRGAFTGATQARRGLLAQADGGTLLLDEVGDMPLALQPKLLRMLQFGEVRPVGSDRLEHVDVRVIAATHRDLGRLIKEGTFREDLHYRLNVIPLLVPPLRSRPEDIPPLVEHFLKLARTRSPQSPVTSFTSEALEILSRAPWLGNVRELENTIERLVVLGRNAQVTASELAFLGATAATDAWSASDGKLYTLKEMSQRYSAWVLLQTDGDRRRAAQILGIDLSTLYRWQRAKN